MDDDANFGFPVDQINVVDCDVNQKGMDIREKDVVRPSNPRWCFSCSPEREAWKTKNHSRWCFSCSPEREVWKTKNHSRAPTRGDCDGCNKSGPLGKFCNGCKRLLNGPRCMVLKFEQKIIDAQTFAAFLGEGHEMAKADQLRTRQMQNIRSFDATRLRLALWRMHKDEERGVVHDNLVWKKREEFHHLIDE
jgi:hypothetical protein